MRLTTLAAAVGIGHPVMTEMIQRLDRQGLVTRVDDPEDARAALVSLSHAGQAPRGDGQRERRDRLAELLTALPAEDQSSLNLSMRVAIAPVTTPINAKATQQKLLPLVAVGAAAVALAAPVHADSDTDFANQVHVYGHLRGIEIDV